MKLAALAVVLAGCLIKPDRATGDGGAGAQDTRPGDAEGDGRGSGGPFAARLISTAYFGSQGGSSIHNGSTAWQLSTTGLQPGELAIIIGNVDGGTTLLGLSSDFALLAEQAFGPTPGQTYFAFAKTAGTNEPDAYGGSYGAASATGFSAIALIAIAGASAAPPISAHANDNCVMSCTTTAGPAVKLDAPQLTTVADGSMLVFAGGADWLGNGHVAFQPPQEMTALTQLTDEGTATAYNFEHSTLLVATTIQPDHGLTAAYSGQSTNLKTGGVVGGLPWTILIAVAPN